MSSSDVDYDEVCVLCFEKWDRHGAHKAVRLPCGHIYGYRCIKRWVEVRLNCPICKRLTHKCNFKRVFQRTYLSVRSRVDADMDAMIERRRLARARRRAARNRRFRLARRGAFQENVDNQTENEVYENADDEDSN